MCFDISANDDCRDVNGNYSPICDLAEDSADAFDSLVTLAAIAGVTMIILGAGALGEAAAESEEFTNLKYNFTEEKITFEGNPKLENFEINFSNPMLKNDYQQHFKINEENYIGITWRF
jgi:hypothetical protein|tara:strand:- start:982 stop:1338 length:357 start_codon:yes stop_codon:yes gene_type:complete